jgi:hypothetical protein
MIFAREDRKLLALFFDPQKELVYARVRKLKS